MKKINAVIVSITRQTLKMDALKKTDSATAT